ncbi:MAG: D-aminoacyl-tRNA deacylase [Candidatus Kapaibacterium sp.]
MRCVIQRVARARVTVAGEVCGAIDEGLLVLFGVHARDTVRSAEWLAHKVANLRVFPDAEDKMNLSVKEYGGRVLVVSQFTLYADAAKGFRPSFIHAARPEHALPLYETFVGLLGDALGSAVETGRFGAMMDVELVNRGPVTILLEHPLSGDAPGDT